MTTPRYKRPIGIQTLARIHLERHDDGNTTLLEARLSERGGTDYSSRPRRFGQSLLPAPED